MNLRGRRLDDWLRRIKGRSFARRYDNLAERLGEIHPVVVTMARVAEEEYAKENPKAPSPGFLTDHGPAHIQRVIERASDLLDQSNAELNPREVFMLLVAVQLHDAGNIYGRSRHEERVRDVLRRVKHDDLDEVETRAIVQVAEAHGGHYLGDRDRIGKLIQVEFFHNDEVRLQFIAAILRFADELADDRSRVVRFLIEEGKIPRSSEIFHAYARSLHSVRISPKSNEVSLEFVVDLKGATAQLGVGETEQYLVDYIFVRTLKMHYERAYCARFMSREGVDIIRIRVRIRFLDEHGEQFRDPITYDLADSGYPEPQPIENVCTGLRSPDGGLRWTGEMIRAELEARAQGGKDG